MTIDHRLIALGTPGAVAQLLGNTVNTNATATATTKATAGLLTANVTFFTSVQSGAGVLLPPPDTLIYVAIYSGDAANDLKVWASGTNTINALTAGAAFTVTHGKSAIFIGGTTSWIANLSA